MDSEAYFLFVIILSRTESHWSSSLMSILIHLSFFLWYADVIPKHTLDLFLDLFVTIEEPYEAEVSCTVLE